MTQWVNERTNSMTRLPQRHCGACYQNPHKNNKQNYKERIPITGKAKVHGPLASEMAEQLKALSTSGMSLTLHPRHHKVVLWPPWRCPACVSHPAPVSIHPVPSGRPSSSAGLTCCQGWKPEFHTRDSHGGRTEKTQKSCPLTSHKTN